MNLKKQLLHYLEIQPLARERKNKDRALVNILLKEYDELKNIDKEILIEFVKAHNTLDRQWRFFLEKNPHLRGEDYSDKDKLVTMKQRELEYNV